MSFASIFSALSVCLGVAAVAGITCPAGKVTTVYRINDAVQRFSADSAYIEQFQTGCNSAVEVEMAGGRGGLGSPTDPFFAGSPGNGTVLRDLNFQVSPFSTLYVKVGGRAVDRNGGCNLKANPTGWEQDSRATNGGGARPQFVGTGGGGASDSK
jgi:hypothetical protein